jgi:hypothetical protein
MNAKYPIRMIFSMLEINCSKFRIPSYQERLCWFEGIATSVRDSFSAYRTERRTIDYIYAAWFDSYLKRSSGFMPRCGFLTQHNSEVRSAKLRTCQSVFKQHDILGVLLNLNHEGDCHAI